jgi:arsenite oxidase small subunit
MTVQPDETPDESLQVNRRKFLKAAIAVSIALLLGGVGAVWKATNKPAVPFTTGTTPPPTTGFPKVLVANVSNLQVNKPVLFNYPLDNEPNILVKLGQAASGGVGPQGDIVAFSQICQHLGCYTSFLPVGSSPACNSSIKASVPEAYCCCHGGTYDFLHGGNVIAGPPPQAVPQVMLSYDTSTGNIYAIGMSPPSIFGHFGSNYTNADLSGGNLVSSS